MSHVYLYAGSIRRLSTILVRDLFAVDQLGYAHESYAGS